MAQGKLFAKYVSDKGYVSRLCKEPFQLNNKIIQLKKYLTRCFTKDDI